MSLCHTCTTYTILLHCTLLKKSLKTKLHAITTTPHHRMNIVASKNCSIMVIFSDLEKLPISLPHPRKMEQDGSPENSKVAPSALLFRGVLQQETDSRIQTTFAGFWDYLNLTPKRIPWGAGHVCTLSLVLLVSIQQHMSNSCKAKDFQRMSIWYL